MTKFFKFPWAVQGDIVLPPDDLQPDGTFSYNQGFPFDYERPNTDPTYKPVPRDGMNGILNEITGAIGELQRQGVPSYFPEAAPYVNNAMVRYANANWRSTADNNSTVPGAVGSKWVNLGAVTDVGDVKMVATNFAPPGWLKCNGATVSRTQYPDLFAAIGTRFGAGDGSTTFNLPDLRGEFVRGWDDGRGVDPGRGAGSAQAGQNASHNHTATAASSGAHTHTISGSAASGGAHTHTISASAASAGAHTHTLSASAASNGAHTHTLSGTAASAGNHSHTVRQFNLGTTGTPYPIFGPLSVTNTGSNVELGAAGAHTHTVSGTAASAGAHTHAVSGTAASAGDHAHTVTASAASGGAHTHTISGSSSSAGDHTHTVTVAASGGTEARPRNVALLYVIKY